MDIHTILNARRLGLAATGAFALSLAAAGPAAADPPAGVGSVANDTLTVTGTAGSDELALRLADGDRNTLQVDFGTAGSSTFERTTFSRIEIYLLSGDDQLLIDQINGIFADEAVTAFGGSGDDLVLGGDGNELVFGGSGRDSVDGNKGADTAVLGAGQDSFRWDPGDGSDVIDGGAGTDTLDFNGASGNENMSLSANGTRAVFLRDAGNIRMDMDEVEQLDLTTLGGIDTVRVDDMSGTDFRLADVDLSVPGSGDGQVDVTLNGSDRADRLDVRVDGDGIVADGFATETRIAGSEAGDRLAIDAGDGDDTVDVDGAVFARIDVSVDLGPGQK